MVYTPIYTADDFQEMVIDVIGTFLVFLITWLPIILLVGVAAYLLDEVYGVFGGRIAGFSKRR